MSELKEYIDSALKSGYTLEKQLSRSNENRLSLYRKNGTEKRLVLVESDYRNDEVFRTLKRLDSLGYLPNIYEVCSEEDKLFVLEEYVEGENLAKLTAKGRLGFEDIKKYLIDLCCALEILHSNNIVHRDVKPENVIITKSRACLIDLSIARILGNADSNDTRILGTIGYAAPEQFGFSQSLPVTDIYALGVLANVLLTGVHPTVDVPGGKIGKIINKCTATQISMRYQKVTELKNELYKI